MRIQKINEHMIRIFISFNELADRDITLADLFQRTAKTEQLFWELINQAREEVEFNLDQPFWIQATLSANDEFVITVMKQEETAEFHAKDRQKKKSARGRGLEWVFKFNDFEDVLTAAKLLPVFNQLNSDFYEYEDAYYLILSRLGAGQKRRTAEAVLHEFGVFSILTKAFLNEHGKLIIQKNAIPHLLDVFPK
ncbi:MAG: adaptor protein MecA [Peptococcaceae bacterium]|jgi:adapter protein MecA 1/2|nr:adaptor protein MecA [Peptococcaceae bacterium]